MALTGAHNGGGHYDEVKHVPASVPEPHKVMVHLDEYLQRKDGQEKLVQTHEHPAIQRILQKRKKLITGFFLPRPV